VKARRMCREKRLAREEGEGGGSDSDECSAEQNQNEDSVVTR
jgi:hypothetical protein